MILTVNFHQKFSPDFMPSTESLFKNRLVEGLLLMFFLVMLMKKLLLKNVAISRLECTNHTQHPCNY